MLCVQKAIHFLSLAASEENHPAAYAFLGKVFHLMSNANSYLCNNNCDVEAIL